MEIPDWFAPPFDTPDYMYPFWASCLRWAVGEEEILKQFEKETGIKFDFPRRPIDVLIDEATGNNPAENFFFSFIPWFNASIWGSFSVGKFK